MAIQWAGLGPELLVTLDRDSGQPLRTQLEQAIREAIRGERLTAGEKLPSSRELAAQLGVSRGLVQDCYNQLYAEGYLSAKVGSATRVAIGGRIPVSTPASTPKREELLVDFASGVPDLAGFPRSDWTWAQRESLRQVPSAALHYGDPAGSPILRDVLAGYLRRVRAAAADPANLIVCAGFAQGMALTMPVLARFGIDRVAFEDPGYGEDTTVAAARSAGLDTVAVPVDSLGVDVAALAGSGARAVVLTPAHQWPTGVVLAPERRHALVAWASEHDGYIIEDDYDAEFRYDREPVGALQGLAPDRVITLGTVSKSLAPALRLGWILCPPAFAAAIARDKRTIDRGAPLFDQLTLATLIESGRFDRHLRRMRIVYSGRRQALIESLAAHAPAVRLSGLAAGFHAVAHLPNGSDERDVVAAARLRRIGLYPMGDNRSAGSIGLPQLVLGFGNLTEAAIRTGIGVVADLLSPAGWSG